MHKPKLPARNVSMWNPKPSNKAFSLLLLIELHSGNNISVESHPTRDTNTEMSRHTLFQQIDCKSLPGLFALNLMTAYPPDGTAMVSLRAGAGDILFTLLFKKLSSSCAVCPSAYCPMSMT